MVLLYTLLSTVVSSVRLARGDDPAVLINSVKGTQDIVSARASDVLETLAVKGRAPSNDYRRSEFGEGWLESAGCDTRNRILVRDMTDVTLGSDDCVVLSGTLVDPYTEKTIIFQRGAETSPLVQIDHVVSLSDAWQKGAKSMDAATREQFANDQLNLLAVDGASNQAKGNADAASWLPPAKGYRCRYVARQIAVKAMYALWVTDAEKVAMKRVLLTCPDQVLPLQRSQL